MSPLRVGDVDLAERSLYTHEVLGSVLSPVLPAPMFLCNLLWFQALNVFLRSEGHTAVLQMTKQVCLSMELVSKAKLRVEEPCGKFSLLSMCLYCQTKVLTRTQMHHRPCGGHQLDSLVCEALTSSEDSGYSTSFPASSWLVTAVSSVGFGVSRSSHVERHTSGAATEEARVLK